MWRLGFGIWGSMARTEESFLLFTRGWFFIKIACAAPAIHSR